MAAAFELQNLRVYEKCSKLIPKSNQNQCSPDNVHTSSRAVIINKMIHMQRGKAFNDLLSNSLN